MEECHVSIRAKNWRWPFWPPLFRRPCIVHSSTSQRAVEYISTQYISLSCLVQKTKELYRNLSYQVDHDFTFFASSSPSLFSQRGHILHSRMYVPVGWKYYARCGKTPRRTFVLRFWFWCGYTNSLKDWVLCVCTTRVCLASLYLLKENEAWGQAESWFFKANRMASDNPSVHLHHGLFLMNSDRNLEALVNSLAESIKKVLMM